MGVSGLLDACSGWMYQQMSPPSLPVGLAKKVLDQPNSPSFVIFSSFISAFEVFCESLSTELNWEYWKYLAIWRHLSGPQCSGGVQRWLRD